MSYRQDNPEQQRSLEALLGGIQTRNGRPVEDLQFPDLLQQVSSRAQTADNQTNTGQQQQQQRYSRGTPAQQQEMLLYMNNKANFLPDGNAGSFHQGNQVPLKKSSSFLDDQFSSMPLDEDTFSSSNVDNASTRVSISNPQYFDSQAAGGSYREPSIEPQQAGTGPGAQEHTGPDFLFHQGDDAMFTFADDLSTSVGSSINSELLGSSYSSSFSFQPQSFSATSNAASLGANLSSHLSPVVKSPSSSVRASSYLSTSLRNGSLGTPGTPNMRNASMSNNLNGDALYSSSVPRTLSHLSAEEKLRRKREFHNAVERRRRELIKQKIKELGTIVPPSLLNYNNNGKQIKPNKGIILNKTVDYLEYLLHVLEAQERKKDQLIYKIRELEEKKRAQKQNVSSKPVGNVPRSMPEKEESKPNTPTPVENQYEGIDTDVSQERIIDGRAKPQPFSNTTHWGSETSIYNTFPSADFPGNENSNEKIHNNNDTMLPIGDDLEQFLSGDLIEAEDNAKLLFNSGRPSADYLLEFDS